MLTQAVEDATRCDPASISPANNRQQPHCTAWLLPNRPDPARHSRPGPARPGPVQPVQPSPAQRAAGHEAARTPQFYTSYHPTRPDLTDPNQPQPQPPTRPNPNPAPPPSQERLVCFVVKEHGAVDAIPKTALLQFLQQEYEVGGHTCE